MENIITSILEIEQNAKTRIEEAQRQRDKIISDAEAEKDRIVAEKIIEAEEKAAQVSLGEKKKTDEKLAEIESARADEIKRLDRVYEKNHKDWENNIFNAVTGG